MAEAEDEAIELVEMLRERLARSRSACSTAATRVTPAPRVVGVEWLDPPFA